MVVPGGKEGGWESCGEGGGEGEGASERARAGCDKSQLLGDD